MVKLRYPYEPPEFYWNEAETPHIGHSNHLCDIVEEGEVSFSNFKKLVKNPKFICKTCGRAASKDESLCEPDSL